MSGPRSIVEASAADPRQFIAEMLAMAKITAETGVIYAEIGDDEGLTYAVRRHAAYLRAVIATLKDLRAAQEPDAA